MMAMFVAFAVLLHACCCRVAHAQGTTPPAPTPTQSPPPARAYADAVVRYTDGNYTAALPLFQDAGGAGHVSRCRRTAVRAVLLCCCAVAALWLRSGCAGCLNGPETCSRLLPRARAPQPLTASPRRCSSACCVQQRGTTSDGRAAVWPGRARHPSCARHTAASTGYLLTYQGGWWVVRADAGPILPRPDGVQGGGRCTELHR